MVPAAWQWEYRRLGAAVYNILPPDQIKPFLTYWLGREWEIDHSEDARQPWTAEWLALLPTMEFTLEVMRLADIMPRRDLMSYKTATYDFARELAERVQEREESFQRGVSMEPLVVKADGLELMDGYTRYALLEHLGQDQVYVYLGRQGTRRVAK